MSETTDYQELIERLRYDHERRNPSWRALGEAAAALAELVRERDAARHRLDNLKGLFIEYGEHKLACGMNESGLHVASRKCYCGFSRWAKACEEGNEEQLA